MEALQEKEKAGDGSAVETGTESSLSQVKRALLFRDSLTFFVLTLAAVILYAATSFLFRSFEERRDDLARDYTARGKQALAADQPETAITAFRTALSYAPDSRTNHLLLAEALAEAHHSDEAISYFLSLRETQPTDGFINLELARLVRQKGDRDAALEYYRASSLGTWTGDGMASRRTVQMELADYLIQGGDLAAARAEILLAAADTPETKTLDVVFGDKLQQAQDPADALSYYRKAIELDGHDVEALTRAGRLLYRTGKFAEAHEYLDRAWKTEPRTVPDRPDMEQTKALAEDAERIQQLTLSDDLAPDDFAQHLRTDATLAKARLDACVARNSAGGDVPPALQDLITSWQATGKGTDKRAEPQSDADRDNLRQLIFQTEMKTNQLCGAPAGDDALLLQLAQAHAAR